MFLNRDFAVNRLSILILDLLKVCPSCQYSMGRIGDVKLRENEISLFHYYQIVLDIPDVQSN